MSFLSDTDEEIAKLVPTHARVKYLQDSCIAVLGITEIIEFQNCLPQHLQDFDKNKIYSTIYTDEKNADGVKLAIAISDLAVAGSREADESIFEGRPKFAKLNDSDLSEYYTKEDELGDTEIKGKGEDRQKDDERKASKKLMQKVKKDQQKQQYQEIIDKKMHTLNTVTKLKFDKADVNQLNMLRV